MKSNKNLLIVGRRWFQHSYGNTYHTFEIRDIYNKCVLFKSVSIYGYGNQYKTNALVWLEVHGYDTENVETLVYDVPCKKDL